MKKCFKCGTEVVSEKVFFRDECPRCMTDLHVCLNCSFRDPGKENACREDRADYVKDRDRANYCEYFRFAEGSEKASHKEEAERLWNSLFNKP